MSGQESQSGALVVEEQRGLRQLRFASIDEERFRGHYDQRYFVQVRSLLWLGVVAVIGVTLYGIYQRDISLVTAAFNLGLMLPLMLATLVASVHTGLRQGYQPLLAATALCVGLILSSVTLRASLQGAPYFFAGEVAAVFAVWLALGRLFWDAAAAAVALSVAYTWGLVHWNVSGTELVFGCVLLLAVNTIGALCCLQMELTARRAFRDKSLLENQAERDGLTGLYNRRAFDSHAERLFRQARRDRSPLTVMLIDVDSFKDFNDIYGHQAGDDALKRVARVIGACAQRPLDFAARYGGEEFALVVYGTANEVGRSLPEEIRRAIEAQCIAHAGSTTGQFLTVSIGVAIVTPGTGRSLAGAIQMADEAMYQAKEEGRNRVVVRESGLTPLETGRFRAGRLAAG